MFNSKLMHRTRLLAAALVLSVAAAARGAGPEILNQVPADAYGVVLVNNARTFANKISNAATRLQISLPPDLLGSMTRSVGITSGFDANGSAALVLLKPAGELPAGGGYFDQVPPMVILIPSTNPTLMLEKFNPTDPDKDGISQVTLPDDPEQKGFVAVVEKKWVAFSEKREDLAGYIARKDSLAKAVSPETLKTFESNDLVMWGNVEKLGAGVGDWLDGQHAELVGMHDLTSFVEGGDAFSATLEKHGMNLVFDLTKEFFNDAGASMITVRMTDSGATLGLIAEFKPDSALGKFVAAQENAGAASLKGLPAGNFLVAGAAKWDGKSVATVVGDFIDRILNDPALAKDERLPELKKSMETIRQVTQLTSGMGFTMMEPGARGKESLLSGAFLVESSDPAKLMDMELQTANSALAQQMGGDIKTATTVTPNALTVKDVPLTKMNMKVSLREETPDKPIPDSVKAAFQSTQDMYGPNGLTMYTGVVGKRLLLIYGSDLNLIEAAVTAAQTDGEALSGAPDIAATKDQLVTHPIGVAYLPIARWVTLAPVLSGGPELPPSPNAASAPPVVMSLGVSGHMLTAEVHVPIASIIATQDAIDRMQRGNPGGRVLPNLP